MHTTAEAATVLGVKSRTVAIYINRGLIAAAGTGSFLMAAVPTTGNAGTMSRLQKPMAQLKMLKAIMPMALAPVPCVGIPIHAVDTSNQTVNMMNS